MDKELKEKLDRIMKGFKAGDYKEHKRKILKERLVMSGRLTTDPEVLKHKDQCIKEIIDNMPDLSKQ